MLVKKRPLEIDETRGKHNINPRKMRCTKKKQINNKKLQLNENSFRSLRNEHFAAGEDMLIPKL